MLVFHPTFYLSSYVLPRDLWMWYLKDCLKGELSIKTTTHIVIYITVLSGAVNTQTIQPVCHEKILLLGAVAVSIFKFHNSLN
jgi:hypothetical protein